MYANPTEKQKYGWTRQTVYKILKKREYKGDYIRGKVKTKFKSNIKRNATEDELYIFEHKYEALVSDEDFDSWAKDYTKDGMGSVDGYDNYVDLKGDYNRARKNSERFRHRVDNADLINTSQNKYDRMLSDADAADNQRYDAADRQVAARPGILGKGQRKLNTLAARGARKAKQIQNKATDFIHNKIGLEQ
jgi:hypothetical protein